jgi:hypothetical protein
MADADVEVEEGGDPLPTMSEWRASLKQVENSLLGGMLFGVVHRCRVCLFISLQHASLSISSPCLPLFYALFSLSLSSLSHR